MATAIHALPLERTGGGGGRARTSAEKRGLFGGAPWVKKMASGWGAAAPRAAEMGRAGGLVAADSTGGPLLTSGVGTPMTSWGRPMAAKFGVATSSDGWRV